MEKTYSGPYRVVCRSDKCFTVSVSGRDRTVSVDRFKYAFILTDVIDERADASSAQDDRIVVSISGLPAENYAGVPSALNKDVNNRTRYGRRVRFPDRFQAGFS